VEDEFSQSGKVTSEADEQKTHFGQRAEDLVVSVKECIEKKRSNCTAESEAYKQSDKRFQNEFEIIIIP